MILLSLIVASASLLDDPDFRFCHEDRAFEHNRELCPLLERVPDGSCPGLEAFCDDPEGAPPAGCDAGGGVGGPASGSSGEAEPPSRLDPMELPELGLGAFDGTALAWFLAFLVAFAVGGFALVLLGRLGRRGSAPAALQVVVMEDDAEEEQAFHEVVDDVPDLPAPDLLASAREALDAGDPGRASVLARGAVLRELGGRGVLRLHRARTDREYVRSVPGDLRADLDDVMRAAEQHRWGRVPLQVPRVRSMLEAASRLLVAVLVLLAASPAFASDRYGPIGDVALLRLLDDTLENEVRFRRGGLGTLAEEDVDTLVLDTMALAPSDAEWDALGAWVDDGGHVLIVLGEAPRLGLSERVPVSDCTSGLFTIPWVADGLRAYTGHPGLAWCGDATLVTFEPRGSGLLVGVGETQLAWNGALMVPENQAFWRDLMGHLETVGWVTGPVELATWGQAGSDSPTGALANLDLLPFVVQVLVLWLAVALWRGRRFGRPRPDPGEGERRFVEHVEALARQYRRFGDTSHARREHARWLATTRGPDRMLHDALRAGYPRERAEALVAGTMALAHDEDTEHPVEMEDLWTLMRVR